MRVSPLLFTGLMTGICLSGCASDRGSFVKKFRLSTVDPSAEIAQKKKTDAESSLKMPLKQVEAKALARAGGFTETAGETKVAKTDKPQPAVRKSREIEPVAATGVAKVNLRTEPKDIEPEEDPESSADEPNDDADVVTAAFRKQPSPLAADDYNTPSASPAAAKAPARFEVPLELPGSEVPPLEVPAFDPDQSLDERKTAIEKLYAPLPELPPSDEIVPDQALWSLAELEHVAWENHPGLQQAAALVEVARGQMIQAGLHPNPHVGYEADTVNTLGTAGYHGPYMTQEIVTGGKLDLARCAAMMEFENAQIAYQRTKIDISTRVRDAYYDTLVSQQKRRMLSALAKFSDVIYHAQIELVAGGQAAPYEPLQLRVSAMQARNAVIAAHNEVTAAGRRLGAASGLSDIEHFQLGGRAEAVPRDLEYESAKVHLVTNHTDLRTVQNQIVQTQYEARLEYIKPRIPNLNFYSTVQKDYTGPPYAITYNLQVGAPIPVFDRNQGNILATQSSIIGREREHGATQNRLIGQLAEVLARYETARTLAVNYRDQILPNQVQTYRGVYSRYREAGQAADDNINFGDVIVAQQTLNTVMNEYANVLGNLWQAYVDAAELLQVDDLAQLEAWFTAGP